MLAAALAIVAAGIVIPALAAIAAPTSISLVVNSAKWGGPAANPSSGVCEATSGQGDCTLRAAIEVSNAIGGAPGEVTITVSPSIPLSTKMSGTANNAPDYMLKGPCTGGATTGPTTATNGDGCGAYYNVTAPVTIDLGHRLQMDASANTGTGFSGVAAFFLNGPDISVVNADQVLSSGTSFVVGPSANRVTIDGDTGGGFGQIFAPNSKPARFVAFREGASNVTVTNYQVTGFQPDSNWSGIFVFDPFPPYTPMTNIVVDRVQVPYSTSTTCNSTTGSGCRSRITNFWNGPGSGAAWYNNTINGLTFKNMLVQNLPDQYAFQFGSPGNTGGDNSADITNLVIEDNVFTNNQGYANNADWAFITLPYHKHLHGTSSIANNVFARAASGNQTAIYYYGDNSIAANSTTPSGLTIANNYFNGYTGLATIRTNRSGLATVTGNTFGPATGSQTAPAVAEEYNDSSVMYNTLHGGGVNYSSNQSIRTWAPSGNASVLTGTLPAGALAMDDPRNGALPLCTATVPVSKITDTNNTSQAAGSPVTLQAYWTPARSAEIYLGQVSGVLGTSATVAFGLPVGAVQLPDGSAVTAVNGASGAASGYVRLQTHVEGLGQLESSQYSRLVAVSGTCRPVLTINQAAGMADPTLGRDLHFTLTSTVPLDPGSVTASSFALSAAPVTSGVIQTIDPARLNPRVVSATPVPGSSDTAFDVVVRVDDTATVTVAVGADAVATAAGLTNQNPATSTDNAITFLNPLQVRPPTFTLVTGEPQGKSFTISARPGAPAPTADLAFTATVIQPAGTPLVSLSTTGPIMRAGTTATDPVTVTASAGDVAANTATSIALTVASSDANYDGLVVPSVAPCLFSTDPTLQIAKQAYVEVADASSPGQIQATGTLAASGARLLDGQTVCFVYTITNTSADDWATTLSDVVVTDTDARLGQNGTIGTIPTLAIGQTIQLAACASLIPVDTTTSGS